MINSLDILLVEDEAIDVMTVRRAFRKSGFDGTLHVAGNGLEALAFLRGRPAGASRLLILLDLNMPIMNGIEFLRELRKDAALASLPAVVLTTSNDQRDKVEAFELNVAGYLVKPVAFDDFMALIGALTHYWMLVEMPGHG